ncbi:MAG: hypothetical protein ACQEWU_02775 [Bacillota bacterium]|uniref:Uncharacterized protein n=1 Tax=Virgibacillus salarius TaxID=447199 RepID=A0A941DY02_9BACI|nr:MULTISPECIES: hypothetical protein [Bacillaceae]NAZ08186.1 hypothetical protein [Agaribacter marinus]MBR7795473.1 hypothetical protein [Virgibacillus salarius]MCC2250470.1 hypothetical protein [Virgibacillus sp. AGTR]MDY7043524.1 hypothetical protein [Virgibacillus sp. M23]QRZ19829.1 hypothetical protein JUJ52_09425 [Virgibacillus sp. AGTR]
MKKLFASMALGSLLMIGFLNTHDNNSTELAHELEPEVVSIGQPVSQF